MLGLVSAEYVSTYPVCDTTNGNALFQQIFCYSCQVGPFCLFNLHGVLIVMHDVGVSATDYLLRWGKPVLLLVHRHSRPFKTTSARGKYQTQYYGRYVV